MRPFASKSRSATATPSSAKKATANWRKQGAAMLASLGVLSPVAAAPANANAMHDPQTESIVRVRADNCIALGTDDVNRAPGLRQFFNDIAALPISGAPVVARLSDPVHRFQICLDSSLPSNGVIAAYMPSQNRLFVPANGADIDSVAHEAFHAYQDTLGGLVTPNTVLSPRDAAIAHLLSEASAAAYSAVVIREMALENPGMAAQYAAYINNNTNVYGQGRAFEAAFQASYTANAELPEAERRRLALQAGGQTVVTNLMAGLGNGWRRGYVPRAATSAGYGDQNVNTNTAAYNTHRREIFTRAGKVGDNLQLVHENFYNTYAVSTAEFSLVSLGLEITPVPVPEYSPRRPRR